MTTHLISPEKFLKGFYDYTLGNVQVHDSLKSASSKINQLLTVKNFFKEFAGYAVQGAALGTATLGAIQYCSPGFSDLNTAIAGIAFTALAWPTYKKIAVPVSNSIAKTLSVIPESVLKYTKSLVSKDPDIQKKDRKSLYSFWPFQLAMVSGVVGGYSFFSPHFKQIHLDSPLYPLATSVALTGLGSFIVKNKLEDLAGWTEKQDWFKNTCSLAGRAWLLGGQAIQAGLFGMAFGRAYMLQKEHIAPHVKSMTDTANASSAFISTQYKIYVRPSIEWAAEHSYTKSACTTLKNVINSTTETLSNPTVQKAGLTIGAAAIVTTVGLYALHSLATAVRNLLPPDETKNVEIDDDVTTSTSLPAEDAKEDLATPTPAVIVPPKAEKKNPVEIKELVSKDPDLKDPDLKDPDPKDPDPKDLDLFVNEPLLVEPQAEPTSTIEEIKISMQKHFSLTLENFKGTAFRYIESLKTWATHFFISLQHMWNDFFAEKKEISKK